MSHSCARGLGALCLHEDHDQDSPKSNPWQQAAEHAVFQEQLNAANAAYAAALESTRPDSPKPTKSPCLLGADPDWLAQHKALRDLHVRKSATYGQDGDRFFNFTAVAAVTGHAPERYALERIVEKATRALNMIDAGLEDAVREYPDIASLGLICAALQAKRG